MGGSAVELFYFDGRRQKQKSKGWNGKMPHENYNDFLERSRGPSEGMSWASAQCNKNRPWG